MRAFVIIVLILTGLGAAVFALTRTDPESLPQPEPESAAAPAFEPGIALSSPTTPPTKQSDTPPTDPAQRTAVTALPAPAFDGPLLWVRAGGEPAAGAQVWFLDHLPPGLPRTASAPRMTLLQQSALALLADARGEVRLPKAVSRSLVWARSGALHGMLEVNAEATGPFRLELTAVREVVVQDQDGQRLSGIPVGLRGDFKSRSALVWQDATTTDGTADLPPLTTLMSDHLAQYSAVVALPIPMPGIPIDPNAPPDEPAVLTMPPTGSVDVLVSDLDPDATELRVMLRVAGDEGKGDAFVPSAVAPLEHGRALFQRVGLGLLFEVTLERPGQDRPASTQAAGPRLPGETTIVQLSATDSDQRTIIVHLQDENRAALAGQRLDLRLQASHDGSQTTRQFKLETNAKGTLRIAIDDDLPMQATRVLDLQLDRNETLRTARLELPVLRPGANDLGFVILTPPPLVCGGVVVDQHGKGIPNANLEIHSKVDHGSGNFHWDLESTLKTRADDDGKFVIHGLPLRRELAIAVKAPGYMPRPPEPFVKGTGGLHLVLEAAAQLQGSVLLNEELEDHDVRVELIHGNERPTAKLRAGAFAFEALSPGVASVLLRLLGDHGGTNRVDNVTLEAGEVCRDPRLQNVDLTQGLRVLRFTVVDPSGSPVPEARIFGLDGDAKQDRFEGRFVTNGQGRWLTRAPVAGVLVWAGGYAPARVPGLEDGQQIVLAKALRLELRLPAGVSLGASEQLQIHIVADSQGVTDGHYTVFKRNGVHSGSGTLPWAAAPTFVKIGREGRTSIDLPSAGRYRLEAALQEGEVRVVPLVSSTFEVAQQTTPQVLELPVTAQVIEQARR